MIILSKTRFIHITTILRKKNIFYKFSKIKSTNVSVPCIILLEYFFVAFFISNSLDNASFTTLVMLSTLLSITAPSNTLDNPWYLPYFTPITTITGISHAIVSCSVRPSSVITAKSTRSYRSLM